MYTIPILGKKWDLKCTLMNKNIKGCFEWRREVKPPRVTHGREPHQLECQAKVFLCTSPFSTRNIFYNFVLCQSNPGRYTQSHLYQYQCILKTSTYKNGTMEPRNQLIKSLIYCLYTYSPIESREIYSITLISISMYFENFFI